MKWGLGLQCSVGNLVDARCLSCGAMCLSPYMPSSLPPAGGMVIVGARKTQLDNGWESPWDCSFPMDQQKPI